MFLYIRVLFVAVIREQHVNAIAQMKLVGIISAGVNDILELYTTGHITDLNRYGIGVSNVNDGSVGEEYTFPEIEIPANRFIYASRQSQTKVKTFLGCFPIYHFHTNVASFTGTEFVELFYNGEIIDVFGSKSGEALSWKYLKGWAMRLNATGPDGPTWTKSNWKVYKEIYRDNSLNHAKGNLPYPIASYYEEDITIENQRQYSCQDQKPVVEFTTTAPNLTTLSIPLHESSGAVSLHLGTTVGTQVTEGNDVLSHSSRVVTVTDDIKSSTTKPDTSSMDITQTETMLKEATAALGTEYMPTASEMVVQRSYLTQAHVKSPFFDQTERRDNEQTGQLSYLSSSPEFIQNEMFTYSSTPVNLRDSMQTSFFLTASSHHPVYPIDGNEVQISNSIMSTKAMDTSQFTTLTIPVIDTTYVQSQIESTSFSESVVESRFVSDTATSTDDILQTSMQAFSETNAAYFTHPLPVAQTLTFGDSISYLSKTSISQENTYFETYNMFVKPTSVQVTPSLAFISPEYSSLTINSPTSVFEHMSVTNENVNPNKATSISELIDAVTKSELAINSVVATSTSETFVEGNSLTTGIYPVGTETQYKQTDDSVSLSYSNPTSTQYFVNNNNPSDMYNDSFTTKVMLTTISTGVPTTPSTSIHNQMDTISTGDTSHRYNYSLDVVLYPKLAKLKAGAFQRAKRIQYEPEEAHGAVGIGSVWLIVLIATICFIFLIDLNTYYTHIKTAIRDIKSFIRYLRNKTYDLNGSRSQVIRLDMSPKL
ncbi:unnamed protein product [Owenia fusiformis]|uniref:Uncharacterized protein n=1 Tax=Owenia fusiformis TaxID=6347 RepID=A0A8J1TWN3_OWEFU|nr:unnamed protein product [Owenia fusiformis]